MLILYVSTGCPFCAKVLKTGEELGITFDVRDILQNPEFEQELIEKGGKPQTPYLIDEENNVEMYESDAIVTYLHEHFGNK